MFGDAVTSFWGLGAGIYIFGIVILLLIIKNQLQKPKNIPPGPLRLPLLGYYPFLGKKQHVSLAKLKRKYGGICSIYLGNRFCIVLNDLESLKEAFNQDVFNDRPPNSAFRLSTDTVAFVEHSGVQWSEQRRFSLKVLRNFGFGKTRLEEVIQEEALLFLEAFEKSEMKSSNLEHLLLQSTVNIICVMIFGRRFNYDDPNRRVIDEYLKKIGYVHTPISFHACFPWLRDLLFRLGIRFGNYDYSLAKELIADLVDFNWKEIETHEETMNDEHRDYIDSYLAETKKYTKAGDIFTKNHLNGNLQLLLRAGTLSTRATIQWILMTSAAYPTIQKKIQSEIDQVIGKEKPPSWSDHDKMPYTQAFILEVQRWETPVPMNLMRYTVSDTTLKGYNIPAGTIVLGNFWAVHNDPAVWEQPSAFIPERFLSEDGTKLISSEATVTFSLGRRACPGNTMAKVVAFLYTTTILQKYNVVMPPGEKINLDSVTHISHHPKHFRVVLDPRC